MYQNRVTLTGFLGKDAESRGTRTQQTPFVVLSLATKRSWEGRESGERHSQTEWHRCIVWGRLAEYAALLTQSAHVQCVSARCATRHGDCNRSDVDKLRPGGWKQSRR